MRMIRSRLSTCVLAVVLLCASSASGDGPHGLRGTANTVAQQQHRHHRRHKVAPSEPASSASPSRETQPVTASGLSHTAVQPVVPHRQPPSTFYDDSDSQETPSTDTHASLPPATNNNNDKPPLPPSSPAADNKPPLPPSPASPAVVPVIPQTAASASANRDPDATETTTATTNTNTSTPSSPAASSSSPSSLSPQHPSPPASSSSSSTTSSNNNGTVAAAMRTVGRVKAPFSDLTLSRIAYGGLHWKEYDGDVNRLAAALDTALSVGITTLDLSDVYGWYQDGHGRSNDLLGKVFEMKGPAYRKQFELVCKFGIRLDGGYHVDSSPDWIYGSVQRYLDVLHTDYLDVLMIHNPDPNMNHDAVASTFKNLGGKVRYFGVSNFHQWEYQPLKDAMARQGLHLCVHEMEASVLHPDRITDGTVQYYNQGDNSMLVLAWGPLGGDSYGGKNLLFGSTGQRETRIVGKLTQVGQSLGNRAPDQVAIKWLLSNPNQMIPIVGTTRPDRIRSQSVDAQGSEGFTRQKCDEIMSALYY